MIEQDATHSTQETVLQCDCTDRNGKPKKLYNSHKEVQFIKKLREKEVGKNSLFILVQISLENII